MDALPELDDVLGRAHVVSVPLVTRFRGVDRREAVLLDGPSGWSEFAPFVEYDDAEASTWLAAALDFGWRESGTARLRESIPVNATLPAVALDQIATVLSRFGECRTVKIKVGEPGETLADDVARVRETRRLIGPAGRIRLDANGAWNLDEAEHAVRALEQFDLEYVEQPCATVTELAELRRRIHRIDVLVAADESVRKAADPLAVARAEAADLLVIKAAPLGGIDRALAIVAEAGLRAQDQLCSYEDRETLVIRDRIVAENGHSVVELTPEQIAQFEEKFEGVVAAWAQDMTKAGLDAQSVLDALKQ